MKLGSGNVGFVVFSLLNVGNFPHYKVEMNYFLGGGIGVGSRAIICTEMPSVRKRGHTLIDY